MEQELIKVVKRVILKLPRDALLVKNTQDHPKTRKIVLLINAKRTRRSTRMELVQFARMDSSLVMTNILVL